MPSIRPAGVASDVPSPSWLLREGDTVFAVLEDTDEVASLRIVYKDDHSNDNPAKNGKVKLEELSRVKLPAKSGPTHAAIAVDPLLGRHLITADYQDGTVCVLPIDADDVLGPVAQVMHGDPDHHGPLPAQEGPHAHWILPLADGRVLTTDLGADRIYVHHWEGSRLVRTGFISLAPATGPRDLHVLPGPSGDWRIAVVDEWGCTVTILEPVDRNGVGSAVGQDNKDGEQSEEFWVAQTVGLGGDGGEHPDQAASLAFVPDALHVTDSSEGQDTEVPPFSSGFVYVGLRGSERIVTLYWDGRKLSRLAAESEAGWKGRGISCGGKRPRHIKAVGNMLIVANEVSDNLSLFRVADDGEPVHLGDYPAGSPTVVLPLAGV
ncbi:beta-propeller fold lactonase family protein [Bifidobacterium sp. ESL0784]|uniref:lactonase family protein n=1 Tax=Bifidobacterium sp. ESL0784 TaxID=2983231 RepID=UPI0023F9823E|nr:beta-propeller fold lactonase family protein [Bifidobacterium sp. ESL0784]MDF7640688.1 beta-propeller fold lactonase family protein [Bifidobacterium sp. ESL0784]